MKKTFKDILKEDVKTFLNPEEFGEKHIIDGKEMTISIDEYELLDRETKYKDSHLNGVFKKQLLVYVSREEFGVLPAINKVIRIDKASYRVMDAIREGGIYSLTLEINKGG